VGARTDPVAERLERVAPDEDPQRIIAAGGAVAPPLQIMQDDKGVAGSGRAGPPDRVGRSVCR
jgi:hypothetical protein